MSDATRIGRVLLSVPNFFFIPTREMAVEVHTNTDRAYFVHKGKVVAVAAAAIMTCDDCGKPNADCREDKRGHMVCPACQKLPNPFR